MELLFAAGLLGEWPGCPYCRGQGSALPSRAASFPNALLSCVQGQPLLCHFFKP